MRQITSLKGILFAVILIPNVAFSDMDIGIRDNCWDFLWWTHYRYKGEAVISEWVKDGPYNSWEREIRDTDVDKDCRYVEPDAIWYKKYDDVGWKVGHATGSVKYLGSGKHALSHFTEYTNYWRIEACKSSNPDYEPPEGDSTINVTDEDINGFNTIDIDTGIVDFSEEGQISLNDLTGRLTIAQESNFVSQFNVCFIQATEGHRKKTLSSSMIELKGGEVNLTGDFSNHDLSPESKENDTLEVSFENLDVNFEIPEDVEKDSMTVRLRTNSTFDFSQYKDSHKKGSGENDTGNFQKEGSKIDLEVFPNPVTYEKSYLVYDLNDFEVNDQERKLYIIDLHGKIIKRVDVQGSKQGTVPLDVNELTSGTYLAVLNSNDKVLKTRKFVVQ